MLLGPLAMLATVGVLPVGVAVLCMAPQRESAVRDWGHMMLGSTPAQLLMELETLEWQPQ